MDAEEFFRREAAGLLAEYPGLTLDEIAREMQKNGGDGDPDIVATILAVATEINPRDPRAHTDESLVDDLGDEIPW